MLVMPGFIRHAVAFLHIAACTKCSVTCAGQDHAAGRTSFASARLPRPEIEQFNAHLRIDGIARIGPVEGDNQ